MNTTFELSALYCYGELNYPMPVARERLGLFSSVARAEAFLRDGLSRRQVGNFDLDDDDITVLRFCLQELSVDGPLEYLVARLYAPDGRLCGEIDQGESKPFHGRERKDCRFEVGDLVQVVAGDELEVGIAQPRRLDGVAALPPSPTFVEKWNARGSDRLFLDQYDDSYMVYLGADDHVHPADCELSAPLGEVDPDVVKRLRGRLAARPVAGGRNGDA